MPGSLLINDQRVECRWEVPSPSEGPGLVRGPNELRVTTEDKETRAILREALKTGACIKVRGPTRLKAIRMEGRDYILINAMAQDGARPTGNSKRGS